MSATNTAPHRDAARDFADRVERDLPSVVREVRLFGSTARGDARGVDSDVDLLVLLETDVDVADAEDAVRDLAYDVELDHRVALSLVITTATAFERQKARPFSATSIGMLRCCMAADDISLADARFVG